MATLYCYKIDICCTLTLTLRPFPKRVPGNLVLEPGKRVMRVPGDSLVQRGVNLLSTGLAWPAVAGCRRAETFSQLSSNKFTTLCRRMIVSDTSCLVIVVSGRRTIPIPEEVKAMFSLTSLIAQSGSGKWRWFRGG